MNDSENLKNQQLLEICGLEMFHKIERNKIIEDARRGNPLSQKPNDRNSQN